MPVHTIPYPENEKGSHDSQKIAHFFDTLNKHFRTDRAEPPKNIDTAAESALW